ncbi:uncharacterized protein LOC117171635 isoform X2 [Belonocnema kinseyi]|uniref:uncharacterized protein LOC117171635 isoform X2 n=1 Tax=Belonocnema kinseyi TaxID=2817044 RepID=UPI00143DBCB9|nr:uncharacterized protein LOC117171635 isoform X2 [Belonocnema kinseyi]XP_033215013.1 uncharacterized protein LOC117171635 isoform X2 [Belonocnema kinseyi]
MLISAGTLFLAIDAFLHFIVTSSGTPPKTRDFLANFGRSSENTNYQAGALSITSQVHLLQ